MKISLTQEEQGEMQKKISIKELVDSIAETTTVLGKSNRTVAAVAPIGKASSNSITFCNRKGEEGIKLLRKCSAGVIICHDELPLTADDYKDKTLILVSNPRSAFIGVMKEHFLEEKIDFGIDATAVIDKGAEIHPRVYIGPHCHIEKCKIGEGTIIYGNSLIYSNTRIGRNVIIHTGAIIGAQPHSFEQNKKSELERFPAIGGVIIEDNTWIGPYTIIFRGTMEDTIIGQGTKIASLCSIAHDAVIGKHCSILTGVITGGHFQIGDYSQIGLSVSIRNSIRIGKNVIVGMGSVVTKDVSDGKTVFGVPAGEHGETQKQET